MQADAQVGGAQQARVVAGRQPQRAHGHPAQVLARQRAAEGLPLRAAPGHHQQHARQRARPRARLCQAHAHVLAATTI